MEQLEKAKESDKKVLGLAIAALYFDDSSDFKSYFWQIIRAVDADTYSALLHTGINSRVYAFYQNRVNSKT